MPGWEKSSTQYRYRLIDSAKFESKSWSVLSIKDSNVKAIVGQLKNEFVPKGKDPLAMVVQAYQFEKSKFNIDQAKRWSKIHVDQVFNISTVDPSNVHNLFSAIEVPNEPILILIKNIEGLGWVQVRDINQGTFKYITDSYNKFLLDAKVNNYLCDDMGQPLEATVLVTQAAIQNLNEREYTPDSIEKSVADIQKFVRLGLIIGFDGHPGGGLTETGDVFGFDYTEKEPLYRVVALWYDKESRQVWAKIRFFNTPLSLAYCDRLRNKEDIYVSLRALGPCDYINGKQVCNIDRIDGFDIVENPALPSAKIYAINEINSFNQEFLSQPNLSAVNLNSGLTDQVQSQVILDEIKPVEVKQPIKLEQPNKTELIFNNTFNINSDTGLLNGLDQLKQLASLIQDNISKQVSSQVEKQGKINKKQETLKDCHCDTKTKDPCDSCKLDLKDHIENQVTDNNSSELGELKEVDTVDSHTEYDDSKDRLVTVEDIAISTLSVVSPSSDEVVNSTVPANLSESTDGIVPSTRVTVDEATIGNDSNVIYSRYKYKSKEFNSNSKKLNIDSSKLKEIRDCLLNLSNSNSKQSKKTLVASASNPKGASLMLQQILMMLEKQGVDQRTLGRMEAAFAIGGVEALNSMLAESGVGLEVSPEIEMEVEADPNLEMDLGDAGEDGQVEGDPNAMSDPNAVNPEEETPEEEAQRVAGESAEGTTEGEVDEQAPGGKPVRPKNTRYAMMQEEVAADGTTPTYLKEGTTPTKAIKPGTDEAVADDGAEDVGVPIDNPTARPNPTTPPEAKVNPKPTMAYVDKRYKDATNTPTKNMRVTSLPVKPKHPGGKSQQEPVNLYAKSQGMKDMKNNNNTNANSPLARLVDRNQLTPPTRSQVAQYQPPVAPAPRVQAREVAPQQQPQMPPEFIQLFADMKTIVDRDKAVLAGKNREAVLDNIIASGKCDEYDLNLLPVSLVNKQKELALVNAISDEQATLSFKTRISTLIDAQMNRSILVGVNSNFTQQGNSVPVQFIADDTSWSEWDEKVNNAINDFRKVYKPRAVKEVADRTKVNNPFVTDTLKAWDKVLSHKMALSDWAKDQKVGLKSGKITDSALVIGANDFRNQPVIARVIIRQVFQRLMTLQLVQALGPGRAVGSPGAGGLPFGGEFKFPVLSYNNPSHNRKRYVNGTDPIPQASSNVRFESFFARMRALSFSVEDELRNQLQNGALGIDPVAIMLDDVTQDMARAIDTHILEEHQQTCDEWNAVAVTSELSIVGNTVYSGSGNVTITFDSVQYVYPNGVFAVKLLSGASGGIPIVLPRPTTIYDQTGAQVAATLNPISVTFASTTQVMGELDSSNNVVSSNPITTTDAATTFAPDYEKGYLIFKANSGANGTLMPTTSYSYVTNYKAFNLNVTSGVLPEDYYDGLLNLIMLTAGEMDSNPRYRQPDIALFPSSIAMGTIGISSLFHKRKSPDGLALERGFAQSDTLGEIHGIEMMRTNGQMFAGDRRAILFQRYMVGYGVQMPAIIKGPYNNFFANANGIVQPTAGENWALEMRDVVGTPLPRNGSNVVINHPGITIRFSGRVSAV